MINIIYRNTGQAQIMEKNVLKGTEKLCYVIDPTRKTSFYSWIKILHILMLSFVDKFSLSVALWVIKDLICLKSGPEFDFLIKLQLSESVFST